MDSTLSLIAVARRIARLGLMATVALPAVAYAQSTGGSAEGADTAGNDAPFGEIVVTAQKRDQRTQDVGIAIAAFGGDQMEALGVVDVKDVAVLVPGFTVAKSFRGPPIYTLRGVGFNTPNMSTSSPVGIYLDEVAYPYPIMTEGLSLDLSRVEVLKGPQGTLYGRNTTGGLVNSIANKPTAERSAEVKVSYGSYQSYGIEGFLNGGIAPNLNARLAFDVQRADKGWQVSVTHGQRLGKVDKAAARFSLGWEPSDRTRFLLTANWWKDRSDTQAGQSIAAFPRGLIAFLGLTTPEQWAAAAPRPGHRSPDFQSVLHADQWKAGELGRAEPPVGRDQRRWAELHAGAARLPQG
ncbi:TonB-dependent receptor plug domain-containing protein [Novosphingobium lubricantis]|uniref:TonB-dependent receptor n=1 Tax=Novosphingobium sp. CCH12-A3 TaxID=1768752 RepID=UPI000785F1C8|nr:TonB-dependent receptor plug domain-containing protein [Novosphingobium sp. CCH12-A3]